MNWSERLTPTEAKAEGLIRRDPLRRMPDDALTAQIRECQTLMRLYAGTKQAHRNTALAERISDLNRELQRRRRAA